jgi:thioredoxin 1
VTPRVLTEQADIDAAISAGEAELFNGTPDTHPMGFVVNCPVPVLAPNTFEAAVETAAGTVAEAPAEEGEAVAPGGTESRAPAEAAPYQPLGSENEPAALVAAEAGRIGQPTLVWFHADWCHVCQEIKPVVTAMQADYQGKAAIVKLNIDQPDSSAAVTKYGVRGTPTFVLFGRDGQAIEQFTGWPGEAEVAVLLDRAIAVQ